MGYVSVETIPFVSKITQHVIDATSVISFENRLDNLSLKYNYRASPPGSTDY